MNIKMLRAKMVLKGENQGVLADALEISRVTLCLKMNGKVDFKQSEIEAIAERYELTADEIKEIFFS